MKFYKKIISNIFIVALFLASISPFYFCATQVAQNIKILAQLEKAIGADAIICDSSTDNISKSSDLIGKSGSNGSKKHACDCQFANQKNNINTKFNKLSEVLFLTQKLQFFTSQQQILAADIYSIFSPRSPPFFA